MTICKIMVLFLIFINTSYATEYALDSFNDEYEYYVVNIDIDNDGLYETVVSNKSNGKLFFLKKINGKYKLILETTNFSIDGGERFFYITPVIIPLSQQKDSKNPLVMTIVNSFPPAQFRHNIRYISKDNSWQLASSEYMTKIVNADSSMTLIHCKYEYDNVLLDEELAKNYSNNTFILNSYKTFSGDIFNNENYCSSKTIRD